MKKTLTMQEILNDNQLLKALSEFREESEIKDFCEKLSLEINSTILYNLKKTLENQIEQIENVNKPLTAETLKDVAGGYNNNDYGITTSADEIVGGKTSSSRAKVAMSIIMNFGINLVFLGQGLAQESMMKNMMGNESAEFGRGAAAGLGSRAAGIEGFDFRDLADMSVDKELKTN